MYVYDEETGIYARPDKVGDMPSGPRLFQQVQWRHESTGDTVYAKDPVVQVTTLRSRCWRACNAGCLLPHDAACKKAIFTNTRPARPERCSSIVLRGSSEGIFDASRASFDHSPAGLDPQGPLDVSASCNLLVAQSSSRRTLTMKMLCRS